MCAEARAVGGQYFQLPESLSAEAAIPRSAWGSGRERAVWIFATVVAVLLVARMMKYYQYISADYRPSRPFEVLDKTHELFVSRSVWAARLAR